MWNARGKLRERERERKVVYYFHIICYCRSGGGLWNVIAINNFPCRQKQNCFLWFVNCCLWGNHSFPFFTLGMQKCLPFLFYYFILFTSCNGRRKCYRHAPMDARIIKPSKKRRHLDLSIACPSARVCGAVNSITISNTHVSSFDGGQPKSLVTLC